MSAHKNPRLQTQWRYYPEHSQGQLTPESLREWHRMLGVGRLRERSILWNNGSDEVATGPLGGQSWADQWTFMSGGAYYTEVRDYAWDVAEQWLQGEHHRLIQTYGCEPQAVHEALCCIEEYLTLPEVIDHEVGLGDRRTPGRLRQMVVSCLHRAVELQDDYLVCRDEELDRFVESDDEVHDLWKQWQATGAEGAKR